MRSLAALLVVLLLAGCSTTPPAPSDGSVPAARFAPAVDISGAGGGPEPVVRVAEDGTVYVAAQDGNGGAPHFWASSDGGKTFTASSPSSSSGGEVDVAAGSGGNVFVTQLGNANVISVSRDHGTTWTPSLLGTTQYFDREWAAAFGSLYIVARDFQKANAVASRSDDGGVTFRPAGAPWDAQHEPGIANGNLVATASGLVMPYVCRDQRAICVATSADGGGAWAQRLVAARSADVDNVYPIAAADGARVVVVWSDASDGRVSVYGATSGDGGASWSAPARLSAANQTATLAWVATGGGAWWIVYVATSGAFPSAEAPGTEQAAWTAIALQVRPDDLRTVAGGPVVPAPAHKGSIAHPGRPGDRTFGDFFTVAVTKQGRPLVALTQTTSGVAHDLLVSGS